MTTALRAEVRKLTTTQVLLWMVVLSVGLSLVFSGLFSGFASSSDNTPDARPIELLLNFTSGFPFLVAAILGVIGITGEYRHLTVTPTFLSVPRRGTVVSAKLVTYLLTGLIIGVLSVAAVVALAGTWLSARGFTIALGSGSTIRIIVGVIVATAIYGIFGVGLGALLRNQVAAVVGLVIYLFVAEPILSSIPKVRAAYPYLPGGAAGALTQTTDPNAQTGGYTLLHAWQGGLLLLAYGIVFAVIGSLLTVRRDVT
jgi:ABC-2 type transport system permease protein